MEFKDVKIFVPAKDFKLSLCFYKLLGWKENWVNEILEKLNLSKFSKTKITAPKKEEHAIVCYIWDPSGVLLHFAESY
jgi:hypothetical protein